jgi:hypothetical protein
MNAQEGESTVLPLGHVYAFLGGSAETASLQLPTWTPLVWQRQGPLTPWKWVLRGSLWHERVWVEIISRYGRNSGSLPSLILVTLEFDEYTWGWKSIIFFLWSLLPSPVILGLGLFVIAWQVSKHELPLWAWLGVETWTSPTTFYCLFM